MKLNKFIVFLVMIFIVNKMFSQENILFYDEFSNNTNNWSIVNYGDFYTSIKKGQMIIGNNSSAGSWSQLKTFYLNPTNDFTLETSIIQTGGKIDMPSGIIFGSIDWNNLYCFVISTNGFYKVFKIEDGKYSDIKEWTASSTIYPKYYKNILTIENKENSVFFKINNEIVFMKKNLKFFGTKYGFFIDGRIKIKIDYLKIIHPQVTKNVTGYPITNQEIKKLKIKNFANQDIKSLMFSAFENKLFVSAQNIDNYTDYDIYYSQKNKDESFDTLKKFDYFFNNSYNNSIINFFNNANSLFVNGVYLKDTGFVYGISYTNFENNTWEKSKEIVIENFTKSDKNTDYFATSDKKILLIAIENTDSYGLKDLYLSTLSDKGFYTTPQNLGANINTYTNEGSPFMTEDKKNIFFYSSALPGFGGNDIFVIHRLDTSFTNWSNPQNLGPVVNTSANETNFIIDNSSQKAFFISDKDGTPCIYYLNIYTPFFKNLEKK